VKRDITDGGKLLLSYKQGGCVWEMWFFWG